PYAGTGMIQPGYETSWMTSNGELFSGVLDPMQHGSRHLAVDVSRTEARPDHLVATRLGRWCWDVVAQQVPAPCPDGVDNSFDPGPHGSLPTLSPRFDNNHSITTNGDTWTDTSVSLHLEKGRVHSKDESNQVYDVVGTIDGHPVRARAGVFVPLLFK